MLDGYYRWTLYASLMKFGCGVAQKKSFILGHKTNYEPKTVYSSGKGAI